MLFLSANFSEVIIDCAKKKTQQIAQLAQSAKLELIFLKLGVMLPLGASNSLR